MDRTRWCTTLRNASNHSDAAIQALVLNHVFECPDGSLQYIYRNRLFYIQLVGFEGMYQVREDFGGFAGGRSSVITQGTFPWCMQEVERLVAEQSQFNDMEV